MIATPPVSRRAPPAVWVLCGLLVILAGILAGRALLGPAPSPQRPDLQRILDGLVTGRGRIAPGVTAYVSGPDGTWSGSAGVANVATGEPMPVQARMRLESVGKLWTATTILKLVGEGRLRLDDTVERRLPGALPYGRRITVRQLLNHTSGMVDSNDIVAVPTLYLRRVKDRALRARIAAVGTRLAKDRSYAFPSDLWIEFAAALPLEYAPGTTFHYSNVGYLVAGKIAERVAGTDLATLMRRQIIEPLRLTRAAYDPQPEIRGSHAHGYSLGAGGKLTDTTTWTAGLGANGGVVADARDEARFLQSLMRGRILAPAQLRELKTRSKVSDYGLGTGIEWTGCASVAFGHNGGGDGFESNVLVSGDGSRVAVLLLNGRTADGRGDAIAVDALRSLYCAGSRTTGSG